MRLLFINTDYAEFLRWLYREQAGLEQASYAAQMGARNRSHFGVADYYSHYVRNLRHEAWDVHANNGAMQGAWARENGLDLGGDALPPRSRRTAAGAAAWLLGRALAGPLARFRGPWIETPHRGRWFYRVLEAQIRHYDPDVILNHDLGLNPKFFQRQRRPGRLLVGQIASPLPSRRHLRSYDLLLSSLPHLVETFRGLGLAAELFRFGFDPRILEAVRPARTTIPASFVGSLSRDHASRLQLLEHLAQHDAIQVWGRGADQLPPESPLRRAHRGEAWGIEMYRVLGSSKIALNHHIEMAGLDANNMRLFEATGSGTLLLTDAKRNLADLFEPDGEVVTYRTPQECLQKIDYLLDHERERAAIARAGQRRTMRDHTYARRAQELLRIVETYA